MPEFLGEERRERRENEREVAEGVVEGAVGVLFVAIVFGFPEAATRAADVPVGGIVDGREDGLHSFGDVVAVHVVSHPLAKLMDPPDNVEVERVVEVGRWVGKIAVELPAVNFGVHSEEVVHIPDHREFTGDVRNILVQKGEIFAGEEWTTEEEEAEGVGGEFVHELVWIGEVAEGFTHFAAVVASDDASCDDVFEGFVAEECGVDGVDVVEPCSDLPDVFDDEVSWVVGLEFFLIFEWVVELGEGHGGGFEPAVEDFGDALELFAVDLEGDFVDPWAVIVVEGFAGEFFEFGVAADDFYSALIAFPDWHRGCPEAVAGEIPVGGGVDVFSKAAVFEVPGEPVDVFVFLEH